MITFETQEEFRDAVLAVITKDQEDKIICKGDLVRIDMAYYNRQRVFDGRVGVVVEVHPPSSGLQFFNVEIGADVSIYTCRVTKVTVR